jgi:ElaB/YqjD/DUF883 family membrane-anchored ribosome-binding protein
MNASKRRLLPQPQTLLAELERLSDEFESALAALKDAGNDASHQARATLIERIAAVLAERGTVLDSFETWVRQRTARAHRREGDSSGRKPSNTFSVQTLSEPKCSMS